MLCVCSNLGVSQCDLLNGGRTPGCVGPGQPPAAPSRPQPPSALLCLSCLAVPYDPIEAKPLCQEEISGVSVQRCMGRCFNYTLQTQTPRWAHCCSSTHTEKTQKHTVTQAGVAHQSSTQLCRRAGMKTEDINSLGLLQTPRFPSFT